MGADCTRKEQHLRAKRSIAEQLRDYSDSVPELRQMPLASQHDTVKVASRQLLVAKHRIKEKLRRPPRPPDFAC